MAYRGKVVWALILGGLALSALAFAKTDKSKTIVTYPSAFAVSQPVSELPVDMSIFPSREMPEPRPGPLRFKTDVGPWQQEDPVLQKEIRPLVSATQGVDFDGIPANGWAPSDSNLAVGLSHIVEMVNVQLAVYSKSGAVLLASAASAVVEQRLSWTPPVMRPSSTLSSFNREAQSRGRD